MSKAFDPYHEWLGIPPKDQPPSHYRLLGVEPFETNPNAIENAADQRMAHLKSFQTGKHSALSQRLLNEVAAARLCLLKPDRKAAYDAQLRAEIESQAEPSSGPLDADLKEALRQAPPRKTVAAAAPARKAAPNLRIYIAAGVGVAAALISLIVWLANSGDRPDLAVRSEPKAVPPPVAAQEERPSMAQRVRTSEPTAAPLQIPTPEPKPVASRPRLAPPPIVTPAPAPTPQPKPVAAKPVTSPAPPPQAPKPVETKPEPASVASRQKLAVPEGAALDQARKAAEALFKTDVEKARTDPEKTTLAKRLLSQAAGQGAAADQYMLLLLAQNLASSARDVETTFQCIEQIDGLFTVDRFALKAAILTGWAKDARTADARKWLVEQMLAVGEEALDAGNLEAAKALGQQITAKSSGLRDKDLVQKLKTYRQRFTEAGKDMDELRVAQTALSQDRKNPQANLVVGRYFCFTKGDWTKGLPLLVLGSDPKLKELAEQELSATNASSRAPRPSSPAPLLSLADGWWEFAAACRHSQSSTIKIHAAQWYRQAVADLPVGLARSNAERRLAEVGKLRSLLPAPPLAVAPFDEKQARQRQQRWAEYLGLPVELVNSVGMKFVLIPPGEFEMGSTPEEIDATLEEVKTTNDPWALERIPTEKPRHRVRISRPYYLGVYEVTQAEYAQVMGVNPSSFSVKGKDAAKVLGKDTSRHPVETVSWDDAALFFQKLSALPDERALRGTRRMYRLPSEAEWEYACRAGVTTRWSCGDEEAELPEYGWYGKNANGLTQPAGAKRGNGFGLYDMHGNVWEWCLDWYAKDYYGKSSAVDPPGPAGGAHHVYRGGAWDYAAWHVRSAYRNYGGSGYRNLGLRACLVLAE